MHAPHAADALYFHGHVSHMAPAHWLRHMQVQPDWASPVTDVAWPLQFHATVHAD